MLRHRRKRDGQRGAALVEVALVAPLLFLLIFGIMEFGWAFMQSLDVRHGAREGGRLAAVNYKTTASPTPAVQTTQILTEMCDRMDADANTSVNLYINGSPNVGGEIEVRVRQQYQQLTGFLDFAFHDTVLDSTVSLRIEQQATWESAPNRTTFTACP